MGKHRDMVHIPVHIVYICSVCYSHNSQPHTTSVKKSSGFFFVWLRDTVDRAEANDVTTTPGQSITSRRFEKELEREITSPQSALLGGVLSREREFDYIY